MSIPLTPPKLPEWLDRVRALWTVADDGARLLGTVRGAGAAARFQAFPEHFVNWCAEVKAWRERLDIAEFTDDSLAKPLAVLDAAPPAKFDHSVSRAVVEVVSVLRGRAGSLVREQGSAGVALAIVSATYFASHGSCFSFTQSDDFGVEYDQLRRFVEELTEEGIFEEAGGSTIVRLSLAGRRWFEEQLSEKQEGDATEQPPTISPSSGRTTEVTAHLAFMASSDLRTFVEANAREIDADLSGGSYLSAMILCGSTIEAILLDVAEQIEPKLQAAQDPKWRDKISLPKLLAEFLTLNLIKDSTARMGFLIADHRDLVHPNRRRASKIRIDSKAAEAMVSLMDILAHDLNDAAAAGEIAKLAVP